MQRLKSSTQLVLQVFGANTDVGKTVISGGLCQAAAALKMQVRYIKPVQTGSVKDEDFVRKHTSGGAITADAAPSSSSSSSTCTTLLSYDRPVSPHLAARDGGATPASDEQVIQALARELGEQCTVWEEEGHASGSGALADEAVNGGGLTLVETAGGVLSPGPSGTLQADLYRPLRLPVLLVGDGRLGGIAVTLSALESLKIRGYSVMGLAIIEDEKAGLGNSDFLRERLQGEEGAVVGHRGSKGGARGGAGKDTALVDRDLLGRIPIYRLPPLPPPEEPLHDWYVTAAPLFRDMLEDLTAAQHDVIQQLGSYRKRAISHFWWPFTQHSLVKEEDITVLDSAYGEYLRTWKGDGKYSNILDACGSWWTNALGHGEPGLTMAMAEAAGRYGHIMFPSHVHAPALHLAEEMIVRGAGRGWAQKVFFSDCGSAAVEIALKMALRSFAKKTGLEDMDRMVVVAQEGCYHGDTLGSLDTGEPSWHNQGQHPWYQAKCLTLPPPTLAWKDGAFVLDLPDDIANHNCEEGGAYCYDGEIVQTFASSAEAKDVLNRKDSPLADLYRSYIQTAMEDYETNSADRRVLGAVILEPVLMGGGGFLFVDPLFQHVLVEECRNTRGMPVIFDEVFAGLWRVGVESAREIVGINPDIACYGKLLTGGVLPLALTLTSDDIYNSFCGPDKASALLHGHSYTANPAGCAAATHALRQMKRPAVNPNFKGDGQPLADMWDEDTTVRELSMMKSVERAFSLGTLLVVELKDRSKEEGGSGYGATGGLGVLAKLRDRGLFTRVLGNVLYVMGMPITPKEECERMARAFKEVLLEHEAEEWK